MQDLLSPEEREALLGSFGQAGPRQPTISPAVFPSVSQLPPESTAALSQSLKAWSGDVARGLARQLRIPCVPETPRVQMLARTALAGPEDCVVWAELGVGIDHYLLLTVPRPFAAAACERLFGAPLIMGEDRELTPTEAHLIQDLGAGWVRLLNGVWEGCGARVTSAPDPAAPGGYGSSNWLRFTTDLQCGHVVGAVSVAMSPSTARVLLGEPAQARPDGAPASPELLMDIPLELHAILGEARFTMDELASLQIGDVIALERKVSEPIDIVVEGTRLFRSRAGLAGQMVALEIAGYAGGDASREC